mmetsp:Transcript_14683/g.21666  ORF Transcript_14683/g.21666 Transcript_14683/m.21666 type:complete len:202 (-) Transcript_14683:114-719(-)|eukprot:CAMPEP_0116034526 /NCGR_PEP_ID=MMETSP0321-20121206/19674_1 /TAXON_ID=163516 /ORGANISM="Leptocylindrus danicus var. danicus, Strain B650" /LENGTH=201 /DNA_ID=CAMNT_0003510883 /DNA_START=29 /DNA_END=634 /DNA_ORIENTATION=+
MDSVLAIRYKDGCVIAADQTNARSVLAYQHNLDKVTELGKHTAMGVSGPNADMVNFSEYISKNMALYEAMNHGSKLSVNAQAHYVRSVLAEALRKGPYQVNLMLGGYDEKTKEANLYFLDYLASMQKVNFGCQGYAGAFCLSIMDREWKEDMTKEEALDVIDHCIGELGKRFVIAQPNFIVKVVDKDGVTVSKFGADPNDN